MHSISKHCTSRKISFWWLLVELYYYTSANAEIWLAEPLNTTSHYSSPLNLSKLIIVFIRGETLSAHCTRRRKIPRWIVIIRENLSIEIVVGGFLSLFFFKFTSDLNTERSYIMRLRCSACQSRIPTDGQCSHLIGLFTKSNFSKLPQDFVFVPVFFG